MKDFIHFFIYQFLCACSKIFVLMERWLNVDLKKILILSLN